METYSWLEGPLPGSGPLCLALQTSDSVSQVRDPTVKDAGRIVSSSGELSRRANYLDRASSLKLQEPGLKIIEKSNCETNRNQLAWRKLGHLAVWRYARFLIMKKCPRANACTPLMPVWWPTALDSQCQHFFLQERGDKRKKPMDAPYPNLAGENSSHSWMWGVQFHYELFTHFRLNEKGLWQRDVLACLASEV